MLEKSLLDQSQCNKENGGEMAEAMARSQAKLSENLLYLEDQMTTMKQ
jgi:hypothetical protein